MIVHNIECKNVGRMIEIVIKCIQNYCAFCSINAVILTVINESIDYKKSWIDKNNCSTIFFVKYVIFNVFYILFHILSLLCT